MSGIDVEIGRRLRALRQTREMTMEQVAVRVGVRYQQIQKYESGANRVSADRLFRFAQLFDVPISTFFEEMAVVGEPGAREAAASAALDGRAFRLACEFGRLSEPQKRAVLSLVRLMSRGQEASGRQDGP